MGHTVFTVEGYGEASVECDVTTSDIINRTTDLEDAQKIVTGLIEKFPETLKKIYGYLKPGEKDQKIFPKPEKMRAEVVKKFKEENQPLSNFL